MIGFIFIGSRLRPTSDAAIGTVLCYGREEGWESKNALLVSSASNHSNSNSDSNTTPAAVVDAVNCQRLYELRDIYFLLLEDEDSDLAS